MQNYNPTEQSFEAAATAQVDTTTALPTSYTFDYESLPPWLQVRPQTETKLPSVDAHEPDNNSLISEDQKERNLHGARMAAMAYVIQCSVRDAIERGTLPEDFYLYAEGKLARESELASQIIDAAAKASPKVLANAHMATRWEVADRFRLLHADGHLAWHAAYASPIWEKTPSNNRLAQIIAMQHKVNVHTILTLAIHTAFEVTEKMAEEYRPFIVLAAHDGIRQLAAYGRMLEALDQYP